MKEDTDAKAARLLSSGALRLMRIANEQELVAAVCTGDSAVYQLGHDPKHGWYCSCPSYADCSHLKALWLVVGHEEEVLDVQEEEAG